MNDREIQGWKEIGQRAPRRVKVAASAAVIVAIAAFGALVAFVGVNAFTSAAAPASVASVAATSAPATDVPAAPAPPTAAPAKPAPNNTQPGNRGRGFGGRPEGGGQRGGFGGGFGMRGGMMGNLDQVAKALNMTSDQLRSQMMSGKSLSDIATAQNVDIQVVKDALISSMKAQLDQIVSTGRMQQSQADMILSNFTANIAMFVNAKMGNRGFNRPQFPTNGVQG